MGVLGKKAKGKKTWPGSSCPWSSASSWNPESTSKSFHHHVVQRSQVDRDARPTRLQAVQKGLQERGVLLRLRQGGASIPGGDAAGPVRQDSGGEGHAKVGRHAGGGGGGAEERKPHLPHDLQERPGRHMLPQRQLGRRS